MKFEFLLLVSCLSHLSNSANVERHDVTINDANKQIVPDINKTINMVKNPITLSPLLNGISCYVAKYAFKNLDPEETLKRLADEVKKNPEKVIKLKVSNSTDNSCGLLISKNKTSNDYNFKYDFFEKNDCILKEDTICTNGYYCTDTAMKCCEGNPILACNLYSIIPQYNTSCLQSNNTKCFQIHYGEHPTTPTSAAAPTSVAVVKTTTGYVFIIVQFFITTFFGNSIKSIN